MISWTKCIAYLIFALLCDRCIPFILADPPKGTLSKVSSTVDADMKVEVQEVVAGP